MDSTNKDVSRRTFLGRVAKAGVAAGVAPFIVPRHVLGGPGYQAPSDTLNIAGVGVGGMGENNIEALAGTENIVALCDVDYAYSADVFEAFPDAATYKDYRRMFDEMGDQIDGVVVGTPDHTHAVITLDAMERGKHVYVQKPLTWSVAEARALRDAADRTGVVTQMGNQGHSSNDARLVNEYIRDGAIGTVEEIHIWTNRPIWPQGIPMPEEIQRKPQTLDWDLYLGPAPETGYHEAFHPFRWRGWVDYGTGALGDMGAHLVDHPYWALELGYPTTVETRSTSFNRASWPNASMTFYEFPAGTVADMGERPAVRMTWYDGGLMPPRPDELPEGEELNPGGGVLFIGSEGKLMHDTYGSNPRLLPVELMEDYPTPPELFPRVEGEAHEMNWARAIRGEEEAVSPFSYAAPLTEVMLLGLVSMQAGNRKIEYDAENMQVTNLPEANQYLGRQNPREGWSMDEASAHGRMAGSE
jgi:predicted dehydrogenase